MLKFVLLSRSCLSHRGSENDQGILMLAIHSRSENDQGILMFTENLLKEMKSSLLGRCSILFFGEIGQSTQVMGCGNLTNFDFKGLLPVVCR